MIGFGGYGPDYPDADQSHFNAVAAPLVIYRGDMFRAGEGAFLEGRLVRRDRFELDINLDSSFPTKLNRYDARRGMPDLDYLGETGPRLQVTLAKADRDANLELEFSVRAVLSSDLTNLRYHGLVFHPRVAYQHRNVHASGDRLKLSLGRIFATRRRTRYFYDVAPQFVTAGQPDLAAKAATWVAKRA